jgi:putative SOS response-associated peptidase YedK
VCGRYTLATVDPADLRGRFPMAEGLEIRPRYNVAPGDDVLAVTTDKAGDPRLELLRWGLVPSWAEAPGSSGKLINARGETVAERPAFRQAFASWRCLVLADGFYEWRPGPGGRKEAFHITRGDGGVFAFAGLWSVWRREENTIRSCAIITTAANGAVSPLHDRMPVILAPDTESIWLDSGTPRSVLDSLITPLPDDETAVRAVGPAVNDVRYDGPECLEPPSPPAASQPALF